MTRPTALYLLASLSLFACSSSSSPATQSPDAATPTDAALDTFVAPPVDAGGVDSGATTTIAAARAGNVTTPITVLGVVTAIHGTPGDFTEWYIEDLAGGPSSGVGVFCDPALTSCPTIRAPNLHDLVLVTGTLSTYMGKLELDPTAQTLVQANAALPPVAAVTAADLAPTASSQYRGVLVKLAAKLTVDNVTPPALYDTRCYGMTDAGAGDAAPADAAPVDAGMTFCSGCAPATYAGFQANDGASHEVDIEAFFFNTDHLQSSPECLTQAGAVPVTVGTTFSSVQGILDWDPYSSVQALSPTGDSDYVTP